MAHSQEISLFPIDWDYAAHLHLDGLGDMPASYFEKLYADREVNVFAVLEGPTRVGTLLMRWVTMDDTGERRAEVVALAGERAEQALTKTIISEAERMAAKAGYSSLFFYTRRPGLVRQLAHRAGVCEVMVGWKVS